MVSAAKKRANNKYDLKTYTVLGCKIRKEVADQFRDECKKQGTSPNAIFRDAIRDFMKEAAGIDVSFQKEEQISDTLQDSQDVVK